MDYLIEILFHRLSKSSQIDKIILATSINEENNTLSEQIQNIGFDVFRGSEKDVLCRFYQAAKQYNPQTIVRVTGDCPIIDPGLVDEVIDFFYQDPVHDYVSNVCPPTFPDGLDVEVFSMNSLEKAHKNATSHMDREHVTLFIRSNQDFICKNYHYFEDLSNNRWTVDDINDFKVVKNIINRFAPNLDFSWDKVLDLKNQAQIIFENMSSKRNEGLDLGTGQKLYKRANKLFLVELCFFLKDQKCSYQIIGHHISAKRKVVKFGI